MHLLAIKYRLGSVKWLTQCRLGFALASLVRLCIVILAAVGSFSQQVQAPPPELVADNPKGAPKDTDIFMDFTESMKGFLTAGPDPAYSRLLEVSERAVAAAWGRAPNLFKFGMRIDSLTDRAARFRATSYNTTNGYEDNDLAVVLNRANLANLTIAISDLFQSDNDINKVMAALLAKFPPTGGYGIGVAGYRIPFRGTIFDVGLDHRKFQHNNIRPVYVLAMGRRDWVATYLDSLLTLSKPVGTTNLVLFSPTLVKRLPTLDLAPCANTKPSEIDNCLSVTGLDRVDDLIKGGKHTLAQQYRIRKAVNLAKYTIAARVEPDELAPPYAADSIKTAQVQVRRAAKSGPTVILEEPLELSDAFPEPQVSVRKIPNSKHLQVLVQGEIKAERLARGKLYRYELSVGPSKSQWKVPPWIESWSFSSSAKPDGTKTWNLEPFFWALWNGMSNQRPPELMHVYLYLKKE